MRRSFSGTSHPIHVIHDTGAGGSFSCELNDCREMSNTAKRSGNPNFVCCHLKSVQYVTETAQSRYVLSRQALEELVDKKMRWFKKSREQECIELQTMAENDESPLIAEYSDTNKNTISSRFKHFSVYDGKIHHYSRFKRVVVSYDTLRNKWSCVCCRAKANCVHKSVARWLLNEERPDELFEYATCGVNKAEPEESESELDEVSRGNEAVYPPKQEKTLSKMIEYMHGFKKIPSELPRSLTHGMETYPNMLVPSEEKCHYCDNTFLSQPKQITRNAKIITPNKVIDGQYNYFVLYIRHTVKHELAYFFNYLDYNNCFNQFVYQLL